MNGSTINRFIVTFRVLMDYLHDRRELFTSLLREEKIDFIFDNQSEKAVIYSVLDDYLRSKPPTPAIYTALHHTLRMTTTFCRYRQRTFGLGG